MASGDQLLQARAETVEMIARGVDNLLQLRLYRAGVLVPPDSGTVTVYDLAGAVIATDVVTVVDDVSTYNLLGSATTGHVREEGWRIEWVPTLADGTTRTFVQEAALVRCRLAPPATLDDIFRLQSCLNPDGPSKPIHTKTRAELDAYLDEAWVQIEGRLIAAGRRPWLIMSPQALREPLMTLFLALLYGDLGSRSTTTGHSETAAGFRTQFEGLWSRLKFSYDANDDGVADIAADGTPARTGAQSTVWLCPIPGRIPPPRWPF